MFYDHGNMETDYLLNNPTMLNFSTEIEYIFDHGSKLFIKLSHHGFYRKKSILM